MGGQFVIAGADDSGSHTIGRQAPDRRRLLASAVGVVPLACQGKMRLPAGHGQEDVGQDLGIEQGAVQIATRVVDAVTLAQRIQTVALSRMSLAGHQQRIEHRAVIGDVGPILLPQQREFVVDEADIERRVVNDQLRALDELEEFIGHVTKARLVDQKLVGDAVNRDGPLIHFPVRLQIDVVVPPGELAPDDFHTADLDDPVTIGDRHACGFGIENYHPVSIRFVNRHSALAPK